MNQKRWWTWAICTSAITPLFCLSVFLNFYGNGGVTHIRWAIAADPFFIRMLCGSSAFSGICLQIAFRLPPDRDGDRSPLIVATIATFAILAVAWVGMVGLAHV